MITALPTLTPTPRPLGLATDTPDQLPGRLLVALYPALPAGTEPLLRYPMPVRRLLLVNTTSEELVHAIIGLLQEGGPRSYVHVESLPTDPLVA